MTPARAVLLSAGGLLVAVLVLTAFTLLSGYLPVNADADPPGWERKMAGASMNAWMNRTGPRDVVASTPESVTRGADLYEKNCAACHGTLGDTPQEAALGRAMYPPAPRFNARIPHDPDWKLFWMTKRGIRLTGMPGFSKMLKDEEIWSIIHFMLSKKK